MKHMPPLSKINTQQGIVGIFLSAVLSAALVVAGAQGTKKANMNAYHTGNKSSIEEANQLMLSGLRYTNNYFKNPTLLQGLMDKYKDNQKIILVCSTQSFAQTLIPTEVIDDLWTPEATQEIRIKAVFAPYNCLKPLDIENYRVAFEITGGSGCKGNSAQNSELCSTRAVVMTAYQGTEFNAAIPVETPKAPITPVPSKPPKPKTDKPKTDKPKTDKPKKPKVNPPPVDTPDDTGTTTNGDTSDNSSKSTRKNVGL